MPKQRSRDEKKEIWDRSSERMERHLSRLLQINPLTHHFVIDTSKTAAYTCFIQRCAAKYNSPANAVKRSTMEPDRADDFEYATGDSVGPTEREPRGQGSGPLPGRNVMAVQTPNKTLFIAQPAPMLHLFAVATLPIIPVGSTVRVTDSDLRCCGRFGVIVGVPDGKQIVYRVRVDAARKGGVPVELQLIPSEFEVVKAVRPV